MPGAAKASIIIPTYRRPELLRNLLQSLARQRTEYAFEVIVVNDYPQDDLTALETEFSDIAATVINLSEDHGRSIARNAGVDRARGDILIFIDDDMTVVEDFVDHHMKAHTDARVAVVGNVLSGPEYAGHPFARYIERQGVKKLRPGEEIPPQYFRTGNGSLSKQFFIDVGKFDESFRTYGEDLDLAWRLYYGGARFVFAEGAISYNHQPADIDDMIAKVYEWGRYTLPIFTKRHPRLTRALWVDLAEPIRFGAESLLTTLKKMGLRLVLTPPFYGLARLVYRCTWLGPLLFPVIDFIRVYTYIRAYRESLKNSETAE